jgi:putative redox protein
MMQLRCFGYVSLFPGFRIPDNGILMIETTVQYLDGVKFESTSRGHSVVCDQPVEGAGTDAGMAPPEFLLTSLGTCAAYYAVQYLRARSLPADGLTVRVEAHKAPGPARIASFRIEINVPGLTDERHREGVIRAAKACLIHNTLLHPPTIETVVTDGAVSAAAGH